MKTRLTIIMVLSLVIVMTVATPPALAPPEYNCGVLEDFSLSPNSGPPGTTVQLYGEEAWGNDSAEIWWDGDLLATITTSPAGIFSHTFTVPADATPGVHTVMFKGYDSEDQRVSCPISFTVTEGSGQTLTPPDSGQQGASGTQQSTTTAQQGTYSSTATSLPSTGFPLPLAGVATALAAGGLALTAFGKRYR